jgi:hypothetical protein
MTMEALARGGIEEYRSEYPDGWEAEIASAARALEDALGTQEDRDLIVGKLAGVAQDLECQMVTGASRVGDQLAGLLVGQAGDTLKLWAKNGAEGTVLVIDGVLATGAQIALTAGRAKRHGATRVVGAAIMADPIGLAVCRAELGDEVIALGPIV